MSSALVSMSGSLFQSLYVMIMGEPRTGRHGRINRHRRKGLVGTLSSIVNYGKKKKVRVTNGTVRRVAKKATPRTPASKKPSPAPPSQSLMDELACLKGELAFLGLDSAPVKSSTAKDKDVIKSPAGLGKPPPSPNSTRKSAAPKVAPKPPAASGAPPPPPPPMPGKMLCSPRNNNSENTHPATPSNTKAKGVHTPVKTLSSVTRAQSTTSVTATPMAGGDLMSAIKGNSSLKKTNVMRSPGGTPMRQINGTTPLRSAGKGGDRDAIISPTSNGDIIQQALAAKFAHANVRQDRRASIGGDSDWDDDD